MRRNWTNVVLAVLATLLLNLCQSCSVDIQDFVNMNDGPQVVGFHAGGGSQTRTQMLPNGLSADWVAGDELAVWARNSSGSYFLSNQIFKTYGLDGQRGFFTSTLDSAMPEDDYTYYCCYPVPVSVNGTKVTFDVPAVQDGKASGGADIMIATPVQHAALTPVPDPEDHSGMSMAMNRMMHQFRFYIPADNTVIGNEKITKIVLTFPRDVVGKATMDLTDPTSASVLSEGTSKITMNLSAPLQASSALDTYYACMVMNPTAFDAGESVRVQAYTSSMIAQVDPIDLCARDFQAGHSTPVKLNVKAITDYPYQISFTVSANNLGEKPNSITLTAPQSCIWEGYGSNVFTYAPGRKIEVGEKITLRFEDEAGYRAFSGQSITVLYDSDNALTNQTVKISDLSSVNSVNVSLTVPYLFYEDFSSISSFSDGHDNPGTGLASDTYVGITDNIGTLTSALNGWTGVRVGGQSGTAVRICCRYQNVAKGAYYKGQLYAPPISTIKDGKDVNISVSFRYGGNSTNSKAKPVMYFGVNSLNPLVNPDDADLISGVITGAGYGNKIPATLSPVVVSGEELPNSGGSYTSFTGTKQVTIQRFDNNLRMAWFVTSTDSRLFTNSNSWLYLDDIKVQIAN